MTDTHLCHRSSSSRSRWGLLTAQDQAHSNLNSRSCEDELREIQELSKLFAWYRWFTVILFAALIATCIWSAVACSSCSDACQHRNQPAGQQVLKRAPSRTTSQITEQSWPRLRFVANGRPTPNHEKGKPTKRAQKEGATPTKAGPSPIISQLLSVGCPVCPVHAHVSTF